MEISPPTPQVQSSRILHSFIASALTHFKPCPQKQEIQEVRIDRSPGISAYNAQDVEGD